jgi:nicotinate-nucleotide adenylyltransferase
MSGIGFLGGTFNPPHAAHIYAAVAAADALGLEKVLLIPNYLPPHKSYPEHTVTGQQRLDMVRIAAAADPRLEADDCELSRGGKSYTFDTVCELERRFPGKELWLICGGDMFLTIEGWHKAPELLKKVSVAALPRFEGGLEALLAQAGHISARYGTKTRVLDIPPREMSSSGIRSDIAGRLDDLPDKVAEYIQKNGLYGCQTVEK